MYNSYFGFSAAPFDNKLDQRFLFLGEDHGEVMSALLYFIREKKGLAMVCGDVGTGKTMLLHNFLDKLPAAVQPIVIANPLVDYQELLLYIAKTLEVAPKEETLLGLLDRVKEGLQAAQDQGKTFILIVDEAHLLSDASLEHIRLLSNIETSAGKLLQILLVGQYELSHRLNQPELRQLRQRINVNRFLSPLSAAETRQYVEHRLQKAGSRFDLCFAPESGTLIYKLTGGVPRRINHLCDTALLICMGEGSRQVNRKILKKAQEALETDRIFTARYSPAWRTLTSGRLGKVLVSVLAGVSLLALGMMLGSAGSREGTSQAFRKALPEAVKSSPSPASPTGLSPEGSAAPVPVSVTSVPAGAANPANNARSLPASLTPAKAGKKSEASVAAEAPGVKVSAPAPGEERASPSQGKAAVAAASEVPASRPLQVEVKENDTLTRLAGRWFPGQVALGMTALLLANPQNLNQDMILPGQKLNLPVIEPSSQTIKLKEGIFYAFYGQYYSTQALQKTISELTRQSVRYTVLNTENSEGGASRRVIIGAYETQEDLEQALLRLKDESG
ncbi:MAG: AAA family ATPase [Deltaproteobacteria bacterium]|nr:AAA family ATPase [Deltaproteobacteria bacterium]MBI4796855.1 AAA family ATPase [Deltaproteobacteria bacterium]